jgi:hypothetical protein
LTARASRPMNKHRGSWSKTPATLITSMATVMVLRAKTCPKDFEQSRTSLRSKVGGGGSQKLAVALLGVHTPSKNLAPVSRRQAYIAYVLGSKFSEVLHSTGPMWHGFLCGSGDKKPRVHIWSARFTPNGLAHKPHSQADYLCNWQSCTKRSLSPRRHYAGIWGE